jgi:hypothetical protein
VKGVKRFTIAVCLMAVAVALQAQTSAGFAQRSEEDLLLFELRLDREVLSPAFPAYQAGDDLLLPLGELARVVTLAIGTDPATGTANGFVIEESNTFRLDLRAGVVVLAGKERRVPAERIEIHRDDLYVPIALLSEWLPIDFQLNFSRLILTLVPQRPLPVQLTRERMRRQSRLHPSELPSFPRLEVPYKNFAVGALDQTVSASYSESSQDPFSLQYATAASGELLGMGYYGYLSGNQDEVLYDRFTIGRQEARGFALLGPIRVTEALAGTVYFPGEEGLLPGSYGEGVLISSFPLQRPDQYDKHTFRGTLPAGWEVELYRNQALIDYQRSGIEGQYEFEDVPLLFGLNVFRLVFYGPFGEVREEFVRFNVGESLTAPGEINYRLTVNEPEVGPRFGFGEVEYGMHRNLVLFAGGGRIEGSNPGSVFKAGFGTNLGLVSFRGGLGRQTDGSTTAHGLLQARVGPLSATVEHEEFGPSWTEFGGSFGNSRLKAKTRARIDGVWYAASSLTLPFGIEYQNENLIGDQERQRLNARLGTSFMATAITGELDLIRSETPTSTADRVVSRLLFSRRWREWLGRSVIAYQHEPRDDLETMEMTAERFLWRNYRAQFGVRLAPISDTTFYFASFARQEGRFLGSGLLGWSDDSGWTVGSSVSVSALFDRLGSVSFRGRSLVNTGVIRARLFLDSNQNGRFDPGETPIQGAGLFINRMARRELTDEQGFVTIADLPRHQDLAVEVNEGTLEDSLLTPSIAGVTIAPRPGTITEINFPLQLLAELTGTVYVGGENSRPIGGIQVVLMDRNGEVVAETLSGYDGFFEMLRVPPGAYLLTINPEQASNVGFSATEPVRVELTPGEFEDGVILTLRRH